MPISKLHVEPPPLSKKKKKRKSLFRIQHVLARHPRPLHLGHSRRHVPLESAQRLDGAPEPGLHTVLSLQPVYAQAAAFLARLDGDCRPARLDRLLVAPDRVPDARGLLVRRLAGHGALQRRHFLEKLFLLGNELRDALALAGVEGLVGVARGGRWREVLGRGDGEAVDGQVRRGEGEGLVDVLPWVSCWTCWWMRREEEEEEEGNVVPR